MGIGRLAIQRKCLGRCTCEYDVKNGRFKSLVGAQPEREGG
jgi:hypothetical protein